MVKITVDKEVFEYIQNHGELYVDKYPNDTLRRLFGLNRKKTIQAKPALCNRKKAPRLDQLKLIAVGVISDGQLVTMRFQKGNNLPEVKAHINGNGVLYQGNRYSYSELTKIILNENGYTGRSYRGPAYWFTEDNISIKDLWTQYLDEYGDL